VREMERERVGLRVRVNPERDAGALLIRRPSSRRSACWTRAFGE